MRKNVLRTALLLIFVSTSLFFSGCGNGKSKISQDPCTILSEEDLKNLFSGPAAGHDISETTSYGNSVQKSLGCQYALTGKAAEKSEDNPFPTPENINIEYIETASPEEAKAAYDKAVELWEGSSIPNRTYEKIEDVGTEAFWSYSFNVSQFITYHDSKVFFITLGYFKIDEDQTLNKAKTVARVVIERV